MAKDAKPKPETQGAARAPLDLASVVDKVSTAAKHLTPPPPAAAAEPVRERQRGDDVKCPQCGRDAFVYTSVDGKHPHFMGRTRHYKCGDPQCGHTFKRVS